MLALDICNTAEDLPTSGRNGPTLTCKSSDGRPSFVTLQRPRKEAASSTLVGVYDRSPQTRVDRCDGTEMLQIHGSNAAR